MALASWVFEVAGMPPPYRLIVKVENEDERVVRIE